VFERLDDLVGEYDAVLSQLSDPAVIADQRRLREVSRRQHELEPIVGAYRSYLTAQGDLEVAHDLFVGAEGDDRDVVSDEIAGAEKRLAEMVAT
jgi:peptide chain release factor 1